MSETKVDPEGNYDATGNVNPQIHITTAPNHNLEDEENENDYEDKELEGDQIVSNKIMSSSIERENGNSSILPEIQLGGSIQNRNIDNRMVNNSSISKTSKKSS